MVTDGNVYTAVKAGMQLYIRHRHRFIVFTAAFCLRLLECNMPVSANAYNEPAMHPLHEKKQYNSKRNVFNAGFLHWCVHDGRAYSCV